MMRDESKSKRIRECIFQLIAIGQGNLKKKQVVRTFGASFRCCAEAAASGGASEAKTKHAGELPAKKSRALSLSLSRSPIFDWTEMGRASISRGNGGTAESCEAGVVEASPIKGKGI